MAQYRIEWDIALDADDEVDAAEQALGIHRDPQSLATVFKVVDVETEEETILDLDPSGYSVIRDGRRTSLGARDEG